MLQLNFNTVEGDSPYYHSYQPLYSLEYGEFLGGEMLLRSEIGPPDLLFQTAIKLRKLYNLDTLSIEKALTSYYSIRTSPSSDSLFINVFPSTILHSRFLPFIEKLLNRFPEAHKQIVFELNESENSIEVPKLKNRIKFLKECGCKIAIDDVGNGWSSISTIIELEPHFVKLDRYFSKNLSTCKKRQKIVECIVMYCRFHDIKLVLEGIETQEDLAMAKALDVHYGQGYYLGKPTDLININKIQTRHLNKI